MQSRADDVRKRIEKRKREKDRMKKNIDNRLLWWEDEERHGFEKISSFEGGPQDGGHPLFSKEIFLFKILASACLILIIAIVFRNHSSSLEPVRNFVVNTMEKDFQFAAVSDWYEDQFGKPLALLPFSNEKADGSETQDETQYVLPASGRILEEFDDNGQRITIETQKGDSVEAMSGGVVSFAGTKEGFGKTVIIQHADRSESWYGNLKDIDVTLYETIEKGTKVGTATDGEDGTKGTFYFAIKKGDDFIDPIQVIQFD